MTTIIERYLLWVGDGEDIGMLKIGIGKQNCVDPGY